MMNTKRILVAADLTNERDAAFDRGLEIARTSGAELYLLHAVPANQRFSIDGTERLRRTAEFRDRAERMGVTLQAVEQHGDPAEIIELHANARAVDLIVMGTERHSKPSGCGGPPSRSEYCAVRSSPRWLFPVPTTQRPTSTTCLLPLTCHPSPRRWSSRQSGWRVPSRRGSRSCTRWKASRRRKPSGVPRDGGCPSTERIFSKTPDANCRPSSPDCRPRLTQESGSRPARRQTRLWMKPGRSAPTSS